MIGCALLPLQDGKVLVAGNYGDPNSLVYDLVTRQPKPIAPTIFNHFGDDVIVLGNRVFLLALDTTDRQIEEFNYK